MLHRAIWKRELIATLSLGLPLVLTNLAQIAMTVTDVLFIGRLGAQALAASALGANLFAAVQFFAFGLVNATAPMVARSLGARSNAVRDVRRTVRQGLWTVIIVSVPGCTLLWFGSDILLAMGQPPELAAMAGEYLRALMWAMPPFLAYIVLRSFAAAMHRPRSALWAALAGIALNALLNWIFVFGHLGMPALGLIGAGLGSSLASLGMLLIMVIVVLRDRQFRRFRLFGDFFQSDRQRLAAFWKLGLPIAAATAFEVTIFNAAAFLMGWLGETELAAHAIAIQIAAVSFMVPFGFAQVATVRVGHAFGAGDAQAASRAGWMAFVVGISAMAVTASLMVLLPYTMIGAFIDMQDPANAAVIPLAVAFLAVAALFQIVDGAQVLGAGMLRGLHDTRVPMVYAALGYWGVGLPAGAMLAFWGGWRGVGIWSGLAIGLGVVSVLMMQRWLRRDALKLSPRPMT